ncbi:MAG: cytochrome c family protein [Bacteroidota bacterium]
MKKLLTYTFLLFLTSGQALMGQFSPGELTRAHADLEGMDNCTKCHDLGNAVSSQKCLECHSEIQSLISANRGYHAAPQVRNQECIACHSEHHGRNFDMVRFDQDNFDHALTGYELEGQHEVIDCRACHKPDYIADADIRKLEGTFLGMGQECLSCHADYHQGTLSNDCATCHNIEAFRPAPRFDHDETDYPLRGAHVEVDCKECHAETTRNGESFQEFSGIDFASCVDCHEDAHRSQLVGACTQCHNETSFSTFLGQRNFNHNLTPFTLKGKHRSTNCYECHDRTSNPLRVFQDQKGVAENDCVSCHQDVHEGKFGSECVQCHQESGWNAMKDMAFFDHSVTDYPLEGQHVSVDCRECHEGSFMEPIDFANCNHCHEDYHQGEFAAASGISPDCIECHSLAQGFDYSLYTLEQHQETVFPLEGAHIATPCFACHVDEKEDRWSFRNIGSECVDCHQNIHEGFIADRWYSEESCVACHVSDAWTAVNFDHSQTDFVLDGAHLETECRACHFEMSADQQSYVQIFEGLGHDCVSCHENVHGDEFAVDGVTDCVRCHVTASWFPEKFDHNLTAFPLDGRHAEVDCRACHEVDQADGSKTIVYKIQKFECIDCHQ